MSARDLLWLAVLALLGYASMQFLRALRAPRGVPVEPKGAPPGDRRDADDEDDASVEDAGFDYAPVIAPAAPEADAVGPVRRQ